MHCNNAERVWAQGCGKMDISTARSSTPHRQRESRYAGNQYYSATGVADLHLQWRKLWGHARLRAEQQESQGLNFAPTRSLLPTVRVQAI